MAINHDLGAITNRVLGERSPIIDIEHTYLYTKKTQGQLMKNAGFRVREVFSVKNRFSVDYLIQLLPVGLGLKGRLIKLAAVLRLSRINLNLKLGNLGVIASRND